MDHTPLALQPPDPNIHIRPVRLGDIEPLRVSCWPERTSEAIYHFISRIRQTASQGRGLGVVVAEQEMVRGYGQLVLWPRCAEISDLIVTADCRGQGLGTAIIQYLTRAARDMHTGCVDIGAAQSNPRALALYRHLGFRDSFTQTMPVDGVDQEVLYLRIKFRR